MNKRVTLLVGVLLVVAILVVGNYFINLKKEVLSQELYLNNLKQKIISILNLQSKYSSDFYKLKRLKFCNLNNIFLKCSMGKKEFKQFEAIVLKGDFKIKKLKLYKDKTLLKAEVEFFK